MKEKIKDVLNVTVYLLKLTGTIGGIAFYIMFLFGMFRSTGLPEGYKYQTVCFFKYNNIADPIVVTNHNDGCRDGYGYNIVIWKVE